MKGREMTKLEIVLLREGEHPEAAVPVRECPSCHSLVAEDKVGGHERFHAQMRRPS